MARRWQVKRGGIMRVGETRLKDGKKERKKQNFRQT